MDCRKSVTDTLGADVEGTPDSFRADGFACMGGEPQSSVAGFRIEVAERFSAGAALVAADADTDDGRKLRAKFRCFAKDAGGLSGTEVANGVEDPVKRDAEFGFCVGAGTLHADEERLKLASAPIIDDANGDVDLGMDNALAGKALEHAPCDQFVVFGSSQVLGHRFEGHEEAGEVGVAIESPGLGEVEGRGIVACAELDEGFWSNGAFQVEMEFGFGEAANERRRFHAVTVQSTGRCAAGGDGQARGAEDVVPMA